MFLNNRQSIILTAIVTVVLFIGGIVGILDNYMVIIILSLGFFAIILNLILVLFNKKNPE